MALAFVCCVAALFAVVFIFETESGPGTAALQPAGLLRWFMAGNWTAKLGGLLLSIGTGALLRYLMLNIELPPLAKIMAGVAMATLLGTVSGVLATRSRAISLALAGAAIAVAYLTAYSAYGFFHFVPDLQALGMLVIVANVGTVVAITRRSLSIAVLAMVGAYIAPAFALHAAGPLPVYGYYVGASLVTLIMVWLRGWRPLIHLSFLFTLAGALFFGWTQRFYTPEHYGQMQPMLLALVALHLVMPLVEGPAHMQGSLWRRRFDEVYFILLPLVAALLTLLIAPGIQREGSLGMVGLALLWLCAAVLQHVRVGEGAPRYLGMAILFLLSAGLLAVSNVPVFLIATLIACVAIAAGRPLQMAGGMELLALVTALASSACYTLQALFQPVAGVALLNLPFAEHVLLAGALFVAGRALQRREHALSEIFLVYSGTWFVIALVRELFRLKFVYLAEIAYLIVLVAIGVQVGIAQLRSRAPEALAMAVSGVVLFATAVASASRFPTAFLIPLMLAGQILYSLLALQCDRRADDSVGPVARSALPVLLLPWAIVLARHLSAAGGGDVILTLLVASALSASLQAQWLVQRSPFWPNWLSPVGFLLFGTVLFWQTVFHIQREPWAVAYELIGLAYLVETARFLSTSDSRDASIFGYVATAAVAAVSAAMLLRLIGPPGTLTILALNQMLLPAIVSLLWAVIGGLLTWFATRRRARALWSLGALLLVAAAVKLILFDFGSLGQIGNILAMMGAGGVFLLVAWLAPFPPPAEPDTPRPPAPPRSDDLGPSMPVRRDQPTSARREGSGSPPRDAPRQSAAPAPASPIAVAHPAQPRPIIVVDRDAGGRGWLWVLGAVTVILAYGYWIAARRAETARAHARVERQQQTVLDALTPSLAADDEASRAEHLPSVQADDVCRDFAARLPDDYLVYSASDLGDVSALRSDGSSSVPVPVDVKLKGVTQNAVLALGAESPTLWRIQEPDAERIAGVILSGRHHGEILGLVGDVPVLHAAYDDHAPCGFFQISARTPQGANGFVSRVLVHAVDANYVIHDGRVIIGGDVGDSDPPVAGHRVDIYDAAYFSTRNGRSLDVTEQLRAKCQAGNCEVRCNNELAGDPDFGQRKNCRFEFACEAGSRHMVRMREGESFRLRCP
jgi:uncharacterized membrane protein